MECLVGKLEGGAAVPKVRFSFLFISLCMVLAFASPSLADPFEQIMYVSDREHFEWEFRLDGFVESMELNLFPQRPPGSGLDPWAVGVGFRNRDGGGVFDDLLFFAQHFDGPHAGDDGAQAFGHLELNYNTRTGLAGVGQGLVFDEEVVHRHTPSPDHQDVFFLGVITEGGELGAPYRYIFTGRHQGEGVPVPESASAVFLGCGLALLATRRAKST